MIKYKLYTKSKEIILNISREDNVKSIILEFIKTPFFILTYTKVRNEIKVNDSFEISSDLSTLKLECQSSCRL